jgi:MFS family permease
MARDPLLSLPFVLCFAACFTQALAFHMYLHLAGFLSQLGADEVLIGLIVASASIAAILGRPMMGRAMDRRGRRFVILAGGVLNVIALCLYLTVTRIGPWVFFVRIAQGVASAMLFSAFFTYAADTIPESRRTEGIGLFGISGMLPVGIGPTLGDWILANAGYTQFFQASAVLAFLSLLISFAIYDQPRHEVHEEPARSFASTLGQRDLMPLWFIGAVFSTATAGAFIFLKTYVVEAGLGTIGSFFQFYSMAAIGLRLFLGWLPDRLGQKRVLIPSLVILGAGLFFVGRSQSSYELALAGTLCGLGHGYAIPILNSLIVSRARDSERGTAMSLATAVFDIGFLVGGPLLGLIIRQAGYVRMYDFAAALAVVGMLAFAYWDRRATRPHGVV